MRRPIAALSLLTAAALTLTGCSALLNRTYGDVTPHNAAPATEGEQSIPRADSYQELVNILIYLVGSGTEEGTVRLYIDSENIEADLAAACLEVVQEDPLGAYAVEDIRYSVTPVVTYAQAEVQIAYRRTPEQVKSIVQATGTSAIRSELTTALAAFAPERVLRISYFEGDEAFIQDLARQAYYDAPSSALGMPEVSVAIYPDSGRQRIVEILLDYSMDLPELQERQREMARALEELARPLTSLSGRALVLAAADLLLESGRYDPRGGSTADALLTDGEADSEGLSLTFAALCEQMKLSCQVAVGEWKGEQHFWNVVRLEDGWRHLDLTASREEDGPLYTDLELQALGYTWPDGTLPACTAG